MPSYVITGASRGIGLGFVRYLGTDPNNQVFAIVRNKASSNDLASFASTHSNVHTIEADVSDHVAVKAAAREVEQITGGSLDVLINNAAVMRSPRVFLPIDEHEPDLLKADLDEMMSVNALGVVHTSNAFLPLLRKGTEKKIICITSASGAGNPETTMKTGMEIFIPGPYSMSKAALNIIVAKYALRFREEGLIFVAISPGPVNTDQDGLVVSEQDSERWKQMVDKFKEVNPTFKGVVSVEESVRKQMEAIEHVSMEDSGEHMNSLGPSGIRRIRRMPDSLQRNLCGLQTYR